MGSSNSSEDDLPNAALIASIQAMISPVQESLNRLASQHDDANQRMTDMISSINTDLNKRIAEVETASSERMARLEREIAQVRASNSSQPAATPNADSDVMQQINAFTSKVEKLSTRGRSTAPYSGRILAHPCAPAV